MTCSDIRAVPSIAGVTGLMLGAAFAASMMMPAAALAEPEFKPTGGSFTSAAESGGTSELKAASDSVTCATATANGAINSATLAGSVTVEFSGCTSSGSVEHGCSVKSTNTSTAGTILTNTLHAVLGLILPKGTGTGVGVLVLPVANKKFVTLASNSCTVESTVSGDVAGEISPIGVSQTTSKVVFAAGEKGESIKTFDLSTGGSVTPELEAFGAVASVGGGGSVNVSAAVEVS